MRRAILILALAAIMAVVMSLSMSPVSAKKGTTCTFEKGTTNCTTVQGSHGSTDSHHGSTDSNGKNLGGGPCKFTGSDQTNTC